MIFYIALWDFLNAQKIKIVVEFMEKGALLSYLQDLKSKSSK